MSQTTDKQTNARPGLGIIGPVRLSYLNVFKPRANAMRDGEMEYSVVALIPKLPNEICKDPKAVGRRATELINEALIAKFGTTPPKWDTCLKDGDAETDSEGKPKHQGYWFIPSRCGADYPPMLIDGKREVVTSGWQSGDWAYVKINFFGYEFQNKKGVSPGLRAIQFYKHDEPFGAPAADPSEFPELDSDPPLSQGAPDGALPDDYDPFA